MRFLFCIAVLASVFVAMIGVQVSGQEAVAEKLSVEKPDVILVVGASGEAEYGEAFTQWAMRWRYVADAAGANLTMIGIDDSPRESGEAESTPDLDRLRDTIAALPSQSRQNLWIVMIGHGTSSQSGSKFNLRGPDLSADQLAGWLKPIERPIVIVNAFSSSAPFLNALSGKDRVVVTATQSGQEQNYSRFGDYLSRAIGDAASDIDHDGEVSILEAFLAASAAVRDFYRDGNRLQTETALIDDNGDSLGTKASAFRGIRSVGKAASADQSLDGDRAAGITLAPPAVRLPLTTEEATDRDEIEAELRRLHAGQSSMTDQEYRDAVLPKWIRLAKIYRAAEERTKPATPAPATPAATTPASDEEAEAKAETLAEPPADPQPDADDAP
jgi:hypothetical protein